MNNDDNYGLPFGGYKKHLTNETSEAISDYSGKFLEIAREFMVPNVDGHYNVMGKDFKNEDGTTTRVVVYVREIKAEQQHADT